MGQNHCTGHSAKKEKDFLSDPDHPLYQASFSWDDHWVAFKRQFVGTSQIMIAPAVASSKPESAKGANARRQTTKELADSSGGALDIAPVLPVPLKSWIAVTDGRTVDDKPRFSPDGDSVYFLSSRDGHTCIWNQRLNPLTKHPIGPPTPYEHRHSLSFDFFRLGRTELSVSKSRIILSIPEVASELWIKQID